MNIILIVFISFFTFFSSVSAAPTPCPVITKWLVLGSRDAQVVTLKQYLMSEGFLRGAKSTAYFGPTTRAALQAWQKKKGLMSSGTPASTGYGATGPKTRSALLNCHDIVKALIQPNTIILSTVTSSVTMPNIPISGGGSSPGTHTITYSWNTGSWGTCSTNTQVRSVTCVSSQSQIVADSNCKESKPATNQSCANIGNTQKSCTFNNQAIGDGASVTAYKETTVTYGTSCTSEARTCSNGTLSGSYTNASCNTVVARSCQFANTTVPNGSTTTAYQSDFYSSVMPCVSEIRKCVNGSLSGSFSYPTCNLHDTRIDRDATIVRKFSTLPTTSFSPPPKVIFWGDSITQYAGDYYNDLFPGSQVLNYGVAGDVVAYWNDRNRTQTIAQGQSRNVSIQSLIAERPGLIFIRIGVNDLISNSQKTALLQNYREFLAYLHAALPDTVIVVESILPVVESIEIPHISAVLNSQEYTPTNNSDINFVNQQIESTAKLNGAHFLWDGFVMADSSQTPWHAYSNLYYPQDGTHPTHLGYVILKHALSVALGIEQGDLVKGLDKGPIDH